ncbi:unnamed protein product, partial [Ectocarpus sp. 12 AP-2014]
GGDDGWLRVNLNHHQTRGRTAGKKAPAAKSKGKERARSTNRKKKARPSSGTSTAYHQEPREEELEQEELDEEEPEEEEEPEDEEEPEEEAEHSDSSYTLDPDEVGSENEESQDLLRPSIAPMRTTLDVRVPRSAVGGGVRQTDFARRNSTGGPGRGASSARGRSSSVGGRTGQPSLLAGREYGRDGGAFGRSGAGASDGRGCASSVGGRAPQSGVIRGRGSGSASGGTAYGRSLSGSSDRDGGGSTTSGAEERHETGVGGVATFNSEMSGQDLFDALDAALVPKGAKAELLGLLLQSISPDVANMLGERSTKKDGPGEKSARGVCANVMAVLAYGFIGPSRMKFSKSGPTNHATNPFMALGSHAWPGARQDLEKFPGDAGFPCCWCATPSFSNPV